MVHGRASTAHVVAVGRLTVGCVGTASVVRKTAEMWAEEEGIMRADISAILLAFLTGCSVQDSERIASGGNEDSVEAAAAARVPLAAATTIARVNSCALRGDVSTGSRGAVVCKSVTLALSRSGRRAAIHWTLDWTAPANRQSRAPATLCTTTWNTRKPPMVRLSISALAT